MIHSTITKPDDLLYKVIAWMPTCRDNRLQQTTTFITSYTHSTQMFQAIIISKPLNLSDSEEIADRYGIAPSSIFYGGDRDTIIGVAMHSSEYQPDTHQSAALVKIPQLGIGCSAGIGVMDDIVSGYGPMQWKLIVGHLEISWQALSTCINGSDLYGEPSCILLDGLTNDDIRSMVLTNYTTQFHAWRDMARRAAPIFGKRMIDSLRLMQNE